MNVWTSLVNARMSFQFPLDRTKWTMPYVPPQQQRPRAIRMRMPATPTGNTMVYHFYYPWLESCILTGSQLIHVTLTYFQGRGSHIEVPSCPMSFRGYWIRTCGWCTYWQTVVELLYLHSHSPMIDMKSPPNQARWEDKLLYWRRFLKQLTLMLKSIS